jgi:hypothetical protein
MSRIIVFFILPIIVYLSVQGASPVHKLSLIISTPFCGFRSARSAGSGSRLNRILDAFSPVLSLVEQATLSVDDYGMSRRHYKVDRTQWRGLLRTFNYVKKLRVASEQINSQGLGNFLSTEDRDLPLELLPNLEEVSYSGCDSQYWYMPFLNAREALGRPVRLTLESW